MTVTPTVYERGYHAPGQRRHPANEPTAKRRTLSSALLFNE